MNSTKNLPFEIAYEIISFVPEYGFLVCRKMHENVHKDNISIYCDTKRFLALHGELYKYCRLEFYDQQLFRLCYNYKTQDVQAFMKQFKEIKDFEPWTFALKLFMDNPVQLCYRYLEGSNDHRHVIRYLTGDIDYRYGGAANSHLLLNGKRSIYEKINRINAIVLAYDLGFVDHKKSQQLLCKLMPVKELFKHIGLVFIDDHHMDTKKSFKNYFAEYLPEICKDIMSSHSRIHYTRGDAYKLIQECIPECILEHMKYDISLAKEYLLDRKKVDKYFSFNNDLFKCVTTFTGTTEEFKKEYPEQYRILSYTL